MFDNLEGAERRSAFALLNGFNRQITSWQRDADELRGVGSVNLRDYLGFTEYETDEVETVEDFRAMLQARRQLIDERVQAQGERMRERNQLQAARARAKRQGKAKRGRPKQNLLKYGQYVYFAVAFNHGQGAGFRGYDVAEPSPQVDYTAIEDWL